MTSQNQIKDYENSFVWLGKPMLSDIFGISRSTLDTYINKGRVNRLEVRGNRKYVGVSVPFLYTASSSGQSLHSKKYPSYPTEHSVDYFERRQALYILRDFPNKEKYSEHQFIQDGLISSVVPHPQKDHDFLYGISHNVLKRISRFRQGEMKDIPKECPDKEAVIMHFRNLVETFDQFECVLNMATVEETTALVRISEEQKAAQALFDKLKEAESLVGDLVLELDNREVAQRCMNFIFDVREIEQKRQNEDAKELKTDITA